MSGKSYRRDRNEKKKSTSHQENKSEGNENVLAASEAAGPGAEAGDSNKISPETDDAPSLSSCKNDAEESVGEANTNNAEDERDGAGDVINIEKVELEKERLARESLEAFFTEQRRKNDWKETLRSNNYEAANNRSDDDKQFFKLDSSLKKNTAFIKKCKTFSEGQKAGLMKEMSGLNLSKYIGEVAAALVEVKLKMSDIPGMVELCSAIHQKYSEFTSCLVENWTKMLTLKKDEKVSNPSKMRVDLRLYCELIVVDVIPLKTGLPLVGHVLSTMVAQDKQDNNISNTAIIVSFCKHCGEDFAGLVPTSMAKLMTRFNETSPVSSPGIGPDKQRVVRNVLTEYHGLLVNNLLNVHKEMTIVERSNRRQLMTRGEISQERTEQAEKLTQEFERLKTLTEQMSEALGEEMVELPKLETEKDEEDEQELANDVSPDSLGHLWDDDDTKAFYENLPDLVAIIPSILYKDSKGESNTNDAKKEAENLDNENEDEIQVDEEPVEEVNLEDDEEVQEAINLSNKMILDAFLGQLPNCVNREMIDSAAADFCMNHNTKNNRKRLVKSLFTVQRTRTDLLPFYSRLVATLNPCMPEVPNQLSALLKQDFRWHVRKKDQINIESKLKVCRFIGEMTKFGVFSKVDTLFCIKQLLFDFSHHHIEMACALFESCGSFLYRSADSHRRTKIYLEQMLRKKAAMSLDSRYTTMIENAYYSVAPPETSQVDRKERPPMHQYIRKLLYTDLNKSNTEKILRQIRKLNWDDPDISNYIVKCLKNVWNLKYFNIRYVTSLLAGLVQSHEWLATDIIDAVLEDVRVGMEINNPKFNQRRTAMVKFLGEMYNYRLIDSSLVFKVLYSLITFGVVLDPEAEVESLDPPDQMIRLRLVCVLLDTCGQYFVSGSSKKKLDYYLLYFQRYFQYKKSCYPKKESFPLGISQLVLDSISALRPKLELFQDFEAACAGVLKVEEEFIAVLKEKMPEYMNGANDDKNVPTADETGLGTISEAAEDMDDLSQMSEGNSQSQTSLSRSRSVSQAGGVFDDGDGHGDHSVAYDDDWEHDSPSQEESKTVEVDEGEENLLVATKPEYKPCAEDEDFLAALDKMVNENIAENKNIVRDKNSMSSMTVPVGAGKSKKNWEQLQQETQTDQEQGVQVQVMLRKGGKGAATRSINVSSDSMLGEQFLAREEREIRERERMKQLTLEISERQEQEELSEALHQLQRVTLGGSGGNNPAKYRHNKGAPDADLIFGKKY